MDRNADATGLIAPPPGVPPGEAPQGPVDQGPVDQGGMDETGWLRLELEGRAFAARPVSSPRRDGIEFEIIAAPKVARDAQGGPVASMTALLSAEPDPGRETVVPLIEAGQFALEAHCRVSPEELDVLGARLGGRAGPAAGAETRLALVDRDDEIAAGSTLGTQGRFALSGRLGRDAALEVMDAMNAVADAETARLILDAKVRLHGQGAPLRLHLEGRWAEVWDALAARADESGRLAQADVDAALMRMLDDGRLVLSGPDGREYRDLEAAAAMFGRISGFILSGDPFGGLVLRNRPAESFPLDVTDTRVVSQTSETEIASLLAPQLARLFADLPLEGYLSLVALTPGRAAPVSQPRRVRSSRASFPGGAAPGRAAAVALAGHHMISAASLARPVSKQTAVSLAHNLTLKPAVIATPVFRPTVPETPPLRSLPVVEEADIGRFDGLLADRVSSDLRWYAPEFSLLAPSGAEDAAFRFEIERLGVTPSGEPALRALLDFRLSGGLPAGAESAAADARAKGINLRAVPLQDVAVTIDIPYLDQATGALRVQRLGCTAQVAGDDLVCTLVIANQWVRLAYGALSRPGFQPEPARIGVRYSFESYAPIDKALPGGLIGAKIRRLGDVEIQGDRLRITRGGAALSLERAQPGAEEATARASAQITAIRPGAAFAKPSPLASTHGVSQLAIKPQLQISPAVLAQLVRRVHVERAQTVARTAEALVPCSRHPEAYVERTEAGTRVLGCQDALLLGRAEPRAFEEIPSLRTGDAAIYRSLLQPDVFLLAPLRYRLTRRPGEDADVPAISLYSVLDPESAGNTLFVYDLHLQPDISPAARRELQIRLAPWSPAPVLRTPGECEFEDIEVTLLTGAEVQHAASGPYLDLSLACDLTAALLVKSQLEASGVSGSVRFSFADGSSVAASILASLSGVDGPWDTGPVEAIPEGSRIRLRNRTNVDHEVSQILALAPFARIPVALTVPAGERAQVETEAAHAEAYAVAAAVGPGRPNLDEQRSFIEDVRSSVVFMADLDFARHGIAAVEIEAEILGTGDRRRVTLTAAARVTEVVFSLPITQLLGTSMLRYSTTRVGVDETRVAAPARETDLSESALVIITAE